MKQWIGFVVNSQVPSFSNLGHGKMWPHQLLMGWPYQSPLNEMRFRWIAGEVNARKNSELRYELYKPWRRYAAVVFLKSMLPPCHALAHKLRSQGTKIILDANTDYYSTDPGEVRYDAMQPTATQRANARTMATLAHLVMASSRHLAGVCSQVNPQTAWVPDNVPDHLLPNIGDATDDAGKGSLQLWWSGEAVKLFEFLVIAESWAKLKERVQLNLVTNSLDALERWPMELRNAFKDLVKNMQVRWHRFTSVAALMKLYGSGRGFIISPRFLDNAYNHSHSEWKITLGMACGLPAICSPVPSYCDVAERAEPGAMRICATTEQWMSAFDDALTARWGSRDAGRAAQDVVKKFYTTSVVARRHEEAIENALGLS